MLDQATQALVAPHFTNRPKTGRPKCSHVMYFGLGCDEAEALWLRAGSCCEICGTPEEQTADRRLFIDHNPYVGYNAVRGLLCTDCNRRLDDPRLWPWSAEYAYAAAHYLANAWYERPGAQSIVHRKPKIDELYRSFRYGSTGSDRLIHEVHGWLWGGARTYCGMRAIMPFWTAAAAGFTRCERCPESLAERTALEEQRRDERINRLRAEIKELRKELRDELAARQRAAFHSIDLKDPA